MQANNPHNHITGWLRSFLSILFIQSVWLSSAVMAATGVYPFTSASELNDFTTYNVTADNVVNGQLLIRDNQTNNYRDAGILTKASYAGDLDVIMQYSDHMLFKADAYQGLLALFLANDSYAWDEKNTPVRPRVMNQIYNSTGLNYSWITFENNAGQKWQSAENPRKSAGYFRLVRQQGKVNAYYWQNNAWKSIPATNPPGIDYAGNVRIGLRMYAYYNDLYQANIEKLLVYADNNGNGLTDPEENLLGLGATELKMPTSLQGTTDVPLRWFKDSAGNLVVMAQNKTATDQPVAFNLTGLVAGTPIELPLDSRSLTSAANGFSDTLPAFERRVWRIGAAYTSLVITTPPTSTLMQPRAGSWVVDLNQYALDLRQGGLTWKLVSISGGTVTATITNGKLTLAPVQTVACGGSTVTVAAINADGKSVQMAIKVGTLGNAGPNLIKNPGFETAGTSSTQIPDWSYYVWDGSSELNHDTLHVGGARAARLQTFGTGKSAFLQKVTLQPGRYRFSAKVASWDLRPGTYNLAGQLYIALPGQDAISVPAASGDQDWTQLSGVFDLKQAGDATVYFFVYGTGYLWADDVSLTLLEPCATDANGFALDSKPMQTLGFTPTVTEDDLLLYGYCTDTTFSQTPICRRLQNVDITTIRKPKASTPLTIASFSPSFILDQKTGPTWLEVNTKVKMPTDWSAYDYLDIKLKNPLPDTTDGYVEIRDTQTTGYWSRVNWYTSYLPGEQTIRIPLQIFVGEKSVIKERRRLDTAHITKLFVGLGGTSGRAEIQSITLSVETPYKHDFSKLIKLDMGTETSPIFYGFTPFTAATSYRDVRGYGLAAGTDIRRSEDRRHPDNLMRDWISIASGGINVDLPNGDYHVWMMLEDPGYWEYYQNYDRRTVTAEGQVKYDATMTASLFWTQYFAHEKDEDLPGDNIWQRYINPRYKPVEFDVTVADGQLNLRFSGGSYLTYANTLSGMLIWPKAQDAEGQAFVTELRQKQEQQYYVEYAENKPLLPAYAVPTTTAQPLASKVLISQRHYMDDVQATDWPKAEELVSQLAMQVAQDEYEPLTVNLYARQAMRLTNAQLTLPGLDSQAYSVRYKLTRAVMDGTRYVNAPALLDNLQFPLAIAAGQSRRLWFSVHAPAGFTQTQVKGSLKLAFADGSSTELPVTVKVLPFALPAQDVPIGYLGSVPGYLSTAFNDAVVAKRDADIIPALDLLKTHGMSAITGGIGGPNFQGYENGAVKVDFTNVDKVMDAAASRFSLPALTYAGLEPGGLGFDTYQVKDMSAYGKTYTQVLTDVLTAVRQRSTARKWPELVYTVGDEPGEDLIVSTNALADAVKAAGGRSALFTSFTSATEPKAAFATHVSELYLTLHSQAAMQYILNSGNDCGTYNLGGRYARGIYQYKLRRLGCKGGYFQFAFNSIHVDPYYALDGREEDFAAALATSTPGKLIPTLDIERFREAIDDYRYLLAVERSIASSTFADAKTKAQTWLQTLLDGMVVDSAQLNTRTQADLDNIRQQAVAYILALKGLNDSDNDGVVDAQDAFPNDPKEWLDTDKDGIGNNADTDDDGDGLPDVWEIQYGLNPLDASDAALDTDGDGLSNREEFKLTTNPTVKNTADITVAFKALTKATPDTFTTHQLTVTNTGTVKADAVVLTVTSPANSERIAMRTSQGSVDCPLSSVDSSKANCTPPTTGDTFSLGSIAAGQTITIDLTNRYNRYAVGNALTLSAKVSTSSAETSTSNNSAQQALTLQAKTLNQGCAYNQLEDVSPYPTSSKPTHHYHALTQVSTDTLPVKLFSYSESGIQALLEGNGLHWQGVWQANSYPVNIWAVAKADTSNRHVGVSTLGGLYWSDDRLSWKPISAYQTKPLNDVAYANGRFVAVGNQGLIITSTDGVTWQVATSRTTAKLAYVDSGNKEFVAGGQGVVLSSTDGLNWTIRLSNTGQDATTLEYGAVWNGSQYLLFDAAGATPMLVNNLASIAYATTVKPTVDGLSEAATSRVWSAIYWQDNQYIALTTKGVLTSTDGKAWMTQKAISYPYVYARLADRAVIAGAYGTVWVAACAPLLPDTLGEQKDVPLASVVESSILTISNLPTSTSLSIVGGEYRLNGGAYTKAAGTAKNGDILQVRHTSATTSATAVTTTVALGTRTLTFKSTTLVVDTTPDTFSFTSKMDVVPNTLVESAAVSINGINALTPVSITGGDYRLNGGTYVKTAGTVKAGDTVQVRHTSSNLSKTAVNTTLTVGGVKAIFTSTTFAIDTVPDAFSFASRSGVALNTVVESAVVTLKGINMPATISIAGGEYRLNGGTYTKAAGTIKNGDTLQVRHTSATTSKKTVTTSVTVDKTTVTFASTTL